MGEIRHILRALQIPNSDSFTTHCFRRGSAVDVLESHGLQAMLAFGQWRSPQAATPYATAGEQTAVGLALAEASGDDM